VVAVRRNDQIVGTQSHNCPNADSFLTDIQMAEPADFTDAVNFGTFLLKHSAQNHLVEHFF
jgi:hypothetical protein